MAYPFFYSQQLFGHLLGADLTDFAALAPHIQRQTLTRGEVVFQQGLIHPYAYVVVSGLVKLVYLRDDGEEWIKSFCEVGEFFASIAALEKQGKTSFAVYALETTVLERIDYFQLEKLATQYHDFERLLRRAFQVFAAKKEKRERELLVLTPQQRYEKMQNDEPGLIQRIPQKDLARYLGLTPVGLNRIVKRSREKSG